MFKFNTLLLFILVVVLFKLLRLFILFINKLLLLVGTELGKIKLLFKFKLLLLF
jgi:hypothetical protein